AALISSLIATAYVILFLCELPLSVSAQSNSAVIPYLPPSSIDNATSLEKSAPTTNSTALQASTEQKSNGALTIKQVIVDTDKVIPHSKFKITPNPFTLKGSLTVHDNNATLDSDPDSGIIVLRNAKFSPYLINETSSPGFGPVLLKTRVTLHKTNPNPVVTIENRQLNLPFTGFAKVTAPYLNDSSLRTFVSNGASVAGGIPLSRVDQLPSGLLVGSEKQISRLTGNASTLQLKPVTFKTSVPATASASQIYKIFKIPTYPAPVKDIASRVTYVSPAFVVKQQGLGNNSITLTPIIAKIFPGMTVLLNQNPSMGSGIAKVENFRMEFSQDANNVGFSFSTSNNVPSSFRLSKVPVDIVALFLNIGYIGAATVPVKVINFSDSKSFAASPDINIVVTKSLDLPITKLPDGCPDIKLYSFNESTGKWQQLDKPIRQATLDAHEECGYILHTQHFSKFAVGGIKEQSSIVPEQ
ncbi:MAG TPA: hypothetical protein VE223_05095, partial [Nitrososphaeraceae archaeon]|nr:hypothetical protein [Nitrososphaeraceae archaeon]